MQTSVIVSALLSEGVSQADALAIVNERYLQANSEARWNRIASTLTTTVAGQSNYSIDADVVDLDYLRIGTTEYEPVAQEQIWGIQSGRLRLRADGVFAPDSQGQLELYPAPAVTGSAIETLTVQDPDPLTVTPDSTPIFPAALHGPILIDGSIALIRSRTDERMGPAGAFEQKYVNAVEDLRLRANRRIGGNRARQAALVGRDF